MKEFTHTTHVTASPDRVWHVLSDLAAVEEYDPFVREAKLPGQQSGVGARRDLKLRPFGSMQQQVSEWSPSSSVELRILRGMPVRDAVAFQRIAAKGTGSSELTMGIRFTSKRGPIGKMMARMTERQVRAGLPKVAAGVVAMAEATP